MPSRFTELAKCKISDTRNIVISRADNGNVIIAQQIEVQEGKGRKCIFLTGAIELQMDSALLDLRNAINMALGE